MKKVLIIENETSIAHFIKTNLQHQGMDTFVAHNGEEGVKEAIHKEWDIILLDGTLPDINGMDVCRKIRERKNTPIITLVTHGSSSHQIHVLDSGADAYLAKPFAIEELLARVRALLRRVEGNKKTSPPR
jgi:DNA-binding response OmpR family regulator